MRAASPDKHVQQMAEHGFDVPLRRDRATGMAKKHQAAVPAAISIVLLAGAWGLLTDDLTEPWHGYRSNKLTRQVEWAPDTSSVTRRDCIEKLRVGLRGQLDYSEPIGCVFRGNNYLRVWLTNLFVDDPYVRCIGRSKDDDRTARYDALIRTLKNEDNWPTCLNPIDVLFRKTEH